MKKIFISASLLAFAFAANAQEVVNLVMNGDFEKPGFVQSVPEGYTWEPWDQQNYLSVLPDWQLSTGGEWNGGVELIEEPGDDDLRPGDDNYICHFVGYNDNGWDAIRVEQAVKGLVPGRQYTFDYL